MSVKQHREKLAEAVNENSIVISCAGVPIHTNEDDYYPFEVNSQFFWLTGLERENMVYVMIKTGGKVQENIFIEEADPLAERWTGKMPTAEEVKRQTEIDDVRYLKDLDAVIDRAMSRCHIEYAYFDTFRCGKGDLPDYNLVKAGEFRVLYPAVHLIDLRKTVIPFREVKDEEEIQTVRKAVSITKQGLDNVLRNLKPGKMEYQVQCDFEAACRNAGAKKFAFATIAGSGLNGCMMHYGTNHCEVKEDGLILLDLGAKYENYCSDITRTYPVSGKYTDRQKEVYNAVLKANQAVAEAARPGMTLRQLNDIAKEVLAEGMIGLGLISDPAQVGKYYMHSVSHSIGIDCHDCDLPGDVLQPGWIISDEPGIYIDEEEIGIRIEDDLLITEDGCEKLSADIISDPDEIEAYIAAHRT